MPFALEPFFLILARLSGLFIAAPIFSSRQIPVRFKVFLVVVLSAVMAFFVPAQFPTETGTPLLFVWALVLELLIGYALGFVAYMVLSGIQLAGQLMDMQMGFAIVNVIDPQSGTQIPLMGNLSQTLALLIYLAMNGHHFLLQGLADSYKYVPVLGLNLGPSFMDEITRMTVAMFVIAIKIAAPIVIAVLTGDIAMGFIARTVPQMNVFVVGMPVKIMMGLLLLLVMVPIFLWVFNMLFTQLFLSLDYFLISMGR